MGVRISGRLREFPGTIRAKSANMGPFDNTDKLKQEIGKHVGLWTGEHKFFDTDGNYLETISTRAEYSFPKRESFEFNHIGSLAFASCSGEQVELKGIFQSDVLNLNSRTALGRITNSKNGSLLMSLFLLDDQRFCRKEMFEIHRNSKSRARTIQWFKDGRLIKSSLSIETLVDADTDH